jgi:hypothetical protein
MLFPTGQIVMTPGVANLGIDVIPYLIRHSNGDWGDMDEADKNENAYSLEHGFRIMSAYNTPQGKLWIITEADRSVTTALLPDEY